VWGTAFGGRSFGPIRAVLVALPYGDKVGHFGLYGAIAMALGLLVNKSSHLAAVGLTVIVLGVADEFRQLSEGSRNFSAGDVLANLAGVSAGLIVAFAIRRMRPANVTGRETQLYKV
jgi:VanZ family protein